MLQGQGTMAHLNACRIKTGRLCNAIHEVSPYFCLTTSLLINHELLVLYSAIGFFPPSYEMSFHIL